MTPRQLAPSEAELLLDFGIGLTDLVKGQSGADSTLLFDGTGPESLREKMLVFQPRVLCFNGKRAAQEFFDTKGIAYGAQKERIGMTVIYVAPSTSGAANGSWDIAYWRDVAERVKTSARHNRGVPADMTWDPRRRRQNTIPVPRLQPSTRPRAGTRLSTLPCPLSWPGARVLGEARLAALGALGRAPESQLPLLLLRWRDVLCFATSTSQP